MSNPRVIAIVGPTASGKTALSLALARDLAARPGATAGAGRKAEIISADSRQIYRGMDIGTAKPTAAERAAVPHHLIDVRYPDEDYTVAEYKHDAIAAINDILSRGNIPLLVGGTGLYIRAVIENLDIPEVKPDPEFRAVIEREIASDSLAAVFRKLVALDPEAEHIVDPNNPRRVVRALEVARATGKPFTAQRKKGTPLFETLELGITTAPAVLRERIEKRIDRMMDEGLVEEVRTLLKKYPPSTATFDAIGYREIVSYLEGMSSLDDAIALMKKNTVQYAKRQMTWFRKDTSIRWISNTDDAFAFATPFLEK